MRWTVSAVVVVLAVVSLGCEDPCETYCTELADCYRDIDNGPGGESFSWSQTYPSSSGYDDFIEKCRRMFSPVTPKMAATCASYVDDDQGVYCQ